VSEGGLSRCGVSASAKRVEREVMADGDVKILGVFQTGGLLFRRSSGKDDHPMDGTAGSGRTG